MSENQEQSIPIQEENKAEVQQEQQNEQPPQTTNLENQEQGTDIKSEEESKLDQNAIQPENNAQSKQSDQDAKLAEALQYDSALMDQQHELIRKEIEDESPLVSDILPLEMLQFEFAQNEPFLKKVKVLKITVL